MFPIQHFLEQYPANYIQSKLLDVFLTVHHSIDFSQYQLSAQLF